MNKTGKFILYGSFGVISIFLLVYLILTISQVQFVSAFSGSGNGTSGDPYQITSWAQLNETRNNLTASYILMNNLSSSTVGYDTYAGPSANSGEGWERIGTGINEFLGTFNGQGFNISDLYLNRSLSDNEGFFGYIGDSGEVLNLGLVNVNMSGDQYIGAIAGNNYGTISNSYSTGTINANGYDAGGLVGYNEGNVSNSYSIINITGVDFIGGLVGYNVRGNISKSYSKGSVTGVDYVGGLVGYHDGWNNYATISNSYSTVNINRSSGTNEIIGGFVGYNEEATISNSYSTGSVYYTGYDDPTNKGFVGAEVTGGSYTDIGNFWDTETSNQTSTTGNAVGKTTAEMQNFDTFNGENWDIVLIGNYFNETWFIDNGVDYPRLGFEWIDTFPPIITIKSPTNSIYNNAMQLVDISAIDINLDAIWYNWNAINISYTTPINIEFNEGSNTLYVYANDTLGNENSTSITFTIDTTTSIDTLPSSGTLPENKTTETHIFINLNPDQPAEMDVNIPKLDVIGVSFTTNETVKDTSITVGTNEGISNIIRNADFAIGLPQGRLYQAFDINTTGINNSIIENVTIEFRIDKAWFEQQRGSIENLSLYRKRDTGWRWDALGTNLTREDSQHYYFSAISPRFSTFVIFIRITQCVPGNLKCFNNNVELCLGNYTWVITKTCEQGCENAKCVGRGIFSISSGSVAMYVIISVISAGIIVILYFVFRYLSKRRSTRV